MPTFCGRHGLEIGSKQESKPQKLSPQTEPFAYVDTVSRVEKSCAGLTRGETNHGCRGRRKNFLHVFSSVARRGPWGKGQSSRATAGRVLGQDGLRLLIRTSWDRGWENDNGRF